MTSTKHFAHLLCLMKTVYFMVKSQDCCGFLIFCQARFRCAEMWSEKRGVELLDRLLYKIEKGKDEEASQKCGRESGRRCY